MENEVPDVPSNRGKSLCFRTGDFPSRKRGNPWCSRSQFHDNQNFGSENIDIHIFKDRSTDQKTLKLILFSLIYNDGNRCSKHCPNHRKSFTFDPFRKRGNPLCFLQFPRAKKSNIKRCPNHGNPRSSRISGLPFRKRWNPYCFGVKLVKIRIPCRKRGDSYLFWRVGTPFRKRGNLLYFHWFPKHQDFTSGKRGDPCIFEGSAQCDRGPLVCIPC